jgi:cysteine desulfurase family protein (TIGR01976 family)
MMEDTRLKVAHFLGAAGGHTISFGQNMTTLNFSLSHAIGKILQPGDEIIITQLDHESNRGPWLALREKGIVVKEVRLLAEGVLDYQHFQQQLTERTRLVAMGFSSNILGTVNEVEKVRKWTHEVGAWLLIDAVHYAPHFPIDVQQLDCDFLLCSAYKFYGPHVGLLYCRPGLLDRLPTERLRTTYQHAPYSIETGTLNHAAIAGVSAAIDFLAGLGEGKNYRLRLHNAMLSLGNTEKERFAQLFEGLEAHPTIRVLGTDATTPHRAPTVAFTLKNFTPLEVCQHLAKHNICAWNGHFYAIRATEILGLSPHGVVRMGISMYNTSEEITHTLKVLELLA